MQYSSIAWLNISNTSDTIEQLERKKMSIQIDILKNTFIILSYSLFHIPRRNWFYARNDFFRKHSFGVYIVKNIDLIYFMLY